MKKFRRLAGLAIVPAAIVGGSLAVSASPASASAWVCIHEGGWSGTTTCSDGNSVVTIIFR